MPAHEWEIARAEEEGVLINNSWGPKKVLGDQAVSDIGLVRCISAFDRAGDFNPVYDEAITSRASAKYVILAIGQTADLSFVKEEEKVETSGDRIEVQEPDLATGEKGLFAGGDVVSGPASIIHAIAHGRKAASAIDQYLGGDGNIDELLATAEDEVLLPELSLEARSRNDLGLLNAWERASGFDQVELGLTDQEIEAESSRCLDCDARKYEVILNVEYCKECGYCAEVCGVGTFGPADFFNAKGYRPEEVKSSDWCVGCFKCYFSCPDFAIDVIEARA
jgi:NAD-dependent dihydropyrimidine dehydrogenase PreA subunit